MTDLPPPVPDCASCAARDQLIAAQAAAIEDLRREVERLTVLVSRNRGNSGMPPSADDLPGRKPSRAKPRRGGPKRPPGKQPGAPGSHLSWSQDPDETIGHFPAGTCECGTALAEARDLGVAASHQQVEIPLASAQVTQHDLHEVACACGRLHRAAAPAGTGAAGTVTYGVALRALCV